MKKSNLLRSLILVACAALLIIGGNARALSQMTVYIPIVLDGTVESPSPTTEPPTTEPPTTEPPNNPPNEPSNPTPADGAIYQHYKVNLSWIGDDPDGDNITFDVYLEPGDNTPDVLVSDDQSATSFDPGALLLGTQYFWQVITTDEHGLSTSGPVWDFETSPPAVSGNITIIDIFYSGEGSSEPNEYVEIRNDDSNPIHLSGWTLRDEANHIFYFPGVEIYPDQICRIYTNENHPEWCSFNYGSGSAIWNNTRDTAYLRDDVGTLIDEYS